MSLYLKVRSVLEYISLMGFNWFIFRLKYEFLKRVNYFDKVNDSILKTVDLSDSQLYIYQKTGLLRTDFQAAESFLEKADEAMKGNVFSFSHEYLDYSENGKITWQMNPVSKVKANDSLPWNNLPDFGEYGDIKLIWEASRFPQVYYFINAYSVTKDEKYAKTCISQIIDWCETNPYPKGVNYKCGQEISFRVFAWVNALEYFYEFFTQEEISTIVQNIYTSLLRVEANIDYAAKSVKNNHSISEAAGLFIGGMLFSQFPESKRFVSKGVKYLLKETAYQVYKDGSYIQHSFTYQRLALDVLSFVFLVAEKKIYTLPKVLKERQLSMVNFLHSFMQENGHLPNYGSNDGANIFPYSESNYRDFRLSLDFAMGKSEFFDVEPVAVVLKKKLEFNDGGYYILKNSNIFSFIRCHSYRDRPAQNDMFHLDVWYKGENIFCDAGSYSYNTDKNFKNNFLGVVGHNTVIVNDSNQMGQVLNFGFSNWIEAKRITFDENIFLGENYAYTKEFGITQKREVELDESSMTVIDYITGISSVTNVKQIWNTKCKVEKIDSFTLRVSNCIISSSIEFKLEDSYISEYYNSYDKGTRIIFEVDTEKEIKIVTKMEFSL